MRRTLTVLVLAIALLFVTAAPAAAANWRESGWLDCDYDKYVNSRVRAEGGHWLLAPGTTTWYAPGTSYRTTVLEGWYAFGTWKTGNDAGWYYSWSGSYGYCGN